jgi:hypothetical protein
VIKSMLSTIWNELIARARMLAVEGEDAETAGYLASLSERWRFLDMDHSARHEWLISARCRGQNLGP